MDLKLDEQRRDINKKLFPNYTNNIASQCLHEMLLDCMNEISMIYKKLNKIETNMNLLMLKKKGRK